MKKKFLAALMAAVMIAAALPTAAFAAEVAPGDYGIMALAAGGKVDNFVGSDEDYAGSEYGWLTENQLSSQDGSKDKGLGNGWKKYATNNPLDAAMGEDDTYRVWKLEIDGGKPETAHLWFYNDNTSHYEEAEITAFSESGKGAKCLVIMPDGYRLVGGCFNPASGINATYAGRYASANYATVTVDANVTAWHNEITPHEYYERPVDEYYERTVDEFYERPVTEIMQRYAQRYLIPVFEKKLEGSYKDTLVTRLEYDGDTAKAKPTNGNAFKNGHTYVTVDVADASTGDGVWYTIADSSKNNGKKTPDQYNRSIAYQYNVKIEGNKLTVSFPEDLAYASVGAEIWAKAPSDFKNAPKHVATSVTVDVPPQNNGTVDLYVHMEKLGWYETDANGDYVYQFKEWRYDDSRTVYDEEYTKIDTVYGDYALDHTEYGEYGLADTVYGDYELADTDTTTEKVIDEYTGTLTLTVTDEEGNTESYNVDDSIQLLPGTYTVALFVDGVERTSQEVTIETAGETKTVSFTVDVRNEDQILATEKHYADKEATRHEANKEAEKHYADAEATQEYKDDYIYRDDIKLGDETDAFGEYAVRIPD